MVKFDLRQQGFSMEERLTKKSIVNILWVVTALVMIFGTFTAIILNVGFVYYGNGPVNLEPTSDPGQIPIHFLMALGLLILYFALKLLMTIIFCYDKRNSIQLKVLEKGMPVCFCREALKTWQTVLIYLVPFIIIYGAMAGVCTYQVLLEMEYGFFVMFFIISFFLAFDFALVIYVLGMRFKEKFDYVSIDYHIYEVTLYKNTYVGRGGITAKSHVKSIEEKSKKRMFAVITTCLNPKCDDYANEVDERVKVCPLCGCQIYKAEVLTDVVSCLNPTCGNYGHELKKDIEICSLCGGKTGKLSFKFKPSLKMPAIVTSVTIAGVFVLIRWIMFVFGMDNASDYTVVPNSVLPMVNILGYCSLPIGIIIAILSKSKLAVFIAVLSVLLAVGLINFILQKGVLSW